MKIEVSYVGYEPVTIEAVKETPIGNIIVAAANEMKVDPNFLRVDRMTLNTLREPGGG